MIPQQLPASHTHYTVFLSVTKIPFSPCARSPAPSQLKGKCFPRDFWNTNLFPLGSYEFLFYLLYFFSFSIHTSFLSSTKFRNYLLRKVFLDLKEVALHALSPGLAVSCGLSQGCFVSEWVCGGPWLRCINRDSESSPRTTGLEDSGPGGILIPTPAT